MAKYTPVLISTLLLTACSIAGPKRPQAIKGLITESSSKYAYVLSSATDDRPYFRKVYSTSANRATRDAILYDLMAIVDTNYRTYEMELRDDRNIKDLSTTLIAMGLTSAATVTGGVEMKSILAAIATGVLGTNAAVDKQLFRENTTEAVINEMRTDRDTIAASIINNMKNEDVGDYHFESGLRDIVDYYYAGTVTNALQTLVIKTADNAKSAQTARATAVATPSATSKP